MNNKNSVKCTKFCKKIRETQEISVLRGAIIKVQVENISEQIGSICKSYANYMQMCMIWP